MSKSTLSIFVAAPHPRTIEVPCRLPEAFNFKFGGRTLTAEISDSSPAGFADSYIYRVEHDGETPPTADEFSAADAHATSILATIKSALGITGPVPPGSPLPAIALAYEADCAAYDLALSAHASLPRAITGDAMYWPDPRSGDTSSKSVGMLAKYVEHVVQNAAAQAAP